MNGADFQPPWLLRNPHVQSVLASSRIRRWLSLRRGGDIESCAVEHIVDCGDGVRLQGFHTTQRALPEARGLVVLLHGWEGSARSNYVLSSGARLLREGFDVFRLNFRDHGETHHLNREIFHSCRIDEVVAAVGAIAEHFPARALAIAGFSLGGNFALRYGRDGRQDPGVPFGRKDSFFSNVLRVLGNPPMDAEIHFLEPVEPTPDARRRMAEQS
ncbi:MAG TPA: alpha/beta fold hydrolase, partial [Rhodanobacteraceae bacterium]|nr:alpha/beta fold hydrolase [Rhodanobacteraceae bacterium]